MQDSGITRPFYWVDFRDKFKNGSVREVMPLHWFVKDGKPWCVVAVGQGTGEQPPEGAIVYIPTGKEFYVDWQTPKMREEFADAFVGTEEVPLGALPARTQTR